MRQSGFWVHISLVVASLILLLAWGRLPLFTTDQPAVVDRLSNPDTSQSAVDESSPIALYGSTVLRQLDLLDSRQIANAGLFQLAWILVAVAGIGGLVCGAVALWWPIWAAQSAFVGVVCGVVSLVSLGFLRFQYANMTATSLFDSTAVGWWVLVFMGGVLVGQGLWGRPQFKPMIVVPQPPPFLEKSPEEIFAAIPTDLSSSVPAPRLSLVHMGTNHAYSLDFTRPISIGRGRHNDVALTDEKVSRRHAVMWWQAGWVMITNQSQRSPLYINQQSIVGEHALLLGDTITLGQTHLRLTSE